MTDFIHEQPNKNPSPPTPDPPKSGDRQKRVYVYIAILFTAAFILILWSFLASHRSNQMVLSEIKSNANLLQHTIEQNQQLQEQVDAYEAQIEELETQLTQAQQENDQWRVNAENATVSYNALMRLSKLQALCRTGKFDEAKDFLTQMETDAPGELESSLTVITGQMTQQDLALYNPLELYQSLLELLQ